MPLELEPGTNISLTQVGDKLIVSASNTAGAAITAHENAADPHTNYQKESEKGQANGYAGLDTNGRVPIAQLASGTPNGTKFVRDDGTLAVPAGGGGGSGVWGGIIGTLSDQGDLQSALNAKQTASTLMASISAASDTAAGKVELATNGEAITGTDATRAVTPAAMKAAMDDASSTLGDLSAPAVGTDKVWMARGSTAGMMDIDAIVSYVSTSLGVPLSSLPALPSDMEDTDLLFVVRGGVAYKAVGSQIGSATPDVTAPTVTSRTIPSAGTTLIVAYNESLLASGDGIPNTGDYVLTATGGAPTVSSLAVSGSNVTLTLSRTINSGETVTLAYTQGGSGRVQDAAGNLAADYTAQSVTNNSTQVADGTPPTLSTAAIPTAGTTIILTYNETLTANSPDVGKFSITASGGACSVSSVAATGTTATITTGRTINSGETVAVSYTAGGSGNRIADAAGNFAGNLSSQAVTNNSTAGGATDPLWADVELLVFNDNAAAGTRVLADQSTNALTPPPNTGPPQGAVYINTTAPAGMTTSVEFVWPHDVTWNNAVFNAPDAWTLEAMVYPKSYSVSGAFAAWFSYQSVWVGFYKEGTDPAFFAASAGPGGVDNLLWQEHAVPLPTLNTWHHVAIVHNGTATALYVDGARIRSITDNTDYSTFSLVRACLGNLGSEGYAHLDCMRFTKGTRYTGATYTPPTLPLPTA